MAGGKAWAQTPAWGVTDSDPCFIIRYQKHVHTYRILPDGEDFLAVQVGAWSLTPDQDSSLWLADLSSTLACSQTSQGVPVRRFQTLGELIGLYAQPNQGLVCALLLPVEREREPDPPDDRDVSGTAHCAMYICLLGPFPGHHLFLPFASSQPAFPKAPCP